MKPFCDQAILRLPFRFGASRAENENRWIYCRANAFASRFLARVISCCPDWGALLRLGFEVRTGLRNGPDCRLANYGRGRLGALIA